ncbi:MAG TPA: 2-dehydropantoate 2-reductase N-terminal domain-containing protein [Acidimicrobiales bacterium]|nr:2-dehydropantoate 2-reductase N-terminal domain-containing protein [Acidimicrobiales bacterium]
MRYVVFGAGAVGGAIGGRLFEHGHEVVLVARGPHLEALRARGLELRSPDAALTLPIPAVDRPGRVDFGPDDVVLLATKSQDTAAALDALRAVSREDLPVVCAQNGVDNERMALRSFARVYGMCVMLPASHLEPGVVEVNSSPVTGILDLGRFPSGTDDVARRMAADLEASSFSSRPDPAIMRQKYAKLLMNLGNALEAASGTEARGGELYARARAEGEACLLAAGIDFASRDEDRARRGDLLRLRPVDGRRRLGGSSWQSLSRATGAIEADYLNGEIVLLGRLHGVPTPVNELLRTVANRMARQRSAPGSVSIDDLLNVLLG